MPSRLTRSSLGAVLFALTLPAAAQDIVPEAATGTASSGPPATAVAAAAELKADMDNATTIWDQACAACHGELGQGGDDSGTDIRNTALSLGEVMRVVNAGRNTMPAFAGFTQQELLDISTYVMEAL
jgi:mono/diheme cytochrome c family protein